MVYVITYVIGFIMTLTFLKLFGKKIGIDYDSFASTDYDDWENNAQAYLAFSITWVITAPMFLIVVFFKLLYKFTQWFLKYPNV
jgi:sulfur relay (sulfurtransferase) DsrC/TusE family protein